MTTICPVSRLGPRWLGWALAFVLTACSDREGSFSNTEAKTTLEALWNEPDVGLWLGDVKFMDDNLLGSDRQWSSGETLLLDLPFYKAFASRGVITMADERDLSDRFTDWNDWFQLTQSGVRRTATVSISDHGRPNGEIRMVGNHEKLLLKGSRTRIEEIVANDSVVLGADRYRVVMGTHTHEIPADLRDAFAQVRGDSSRVGRFKVLLKYDPFNKAWSAIARDVANRHEDFHTANVDRFIARLRL